MIRRELYYLSNYVIELHQKGKTIRKNEDVDALIEYIDECVELKCKLIWIHPFGDGNGRTIRAFINKLFDDIGLPPIYIKTEEREEYQKSMNLAIGDNDYTSIKAFYKYKICDSLIELDINDRIKNQVSNGKKKVKTIENSNNI
jgi:fido (protein-threonine AMPylation protein)